MRLRPPTRFIDLTGHLGSLKSSLSPDCKHFEPAPPFWQPTHPAPEPSKTIITLFWLWLLLTAAGCAFLSTL